MWGHYIPQIEISSEYIPSEYRKFYDKIVKKVIYKKNYDDKSGISTLIKNPTAYLMKYILKTFDDLRKDENKISDLTLWYIYHGIGRFYTSRTLIPLHIYRKINHIEKYQDMYQATQEYKEGRFLMWYRIVENIDYETGEIINSEVLSAISHISDKWNYRLGEPKHNEVEIWRKKEFINTKYEPTEAILIAKDLLLKNGLLLNPDEQIEDILDNEEFI